ncbi:RHS repeat-associated core domain containing protein [Nitzschia inconspicua]|uniref:RHS repeat-associated core domain containing protein n=1 Tax=Nitzschia inconspicua TaxID=303405 RepID=A0A9K3KPF1_9STRA|nr:RHS repeat-associated core domain containing protein [Nitzschia inconspicua]KAG7347558.1 RHS repeat-associated core domain containing protein [Nitzschia inconspicua]
MSSKIGLDGDGLTRRSNDSGIAASTSAIESARRFLYDEDEEPPLAPANIPISGSSAFPPFPIAPKGHTNLSRSKRVNPVSAACISTFSTCRGYGAKRLGLLVCGIGLLIGSIWGISAAVSGKQSNESANPRRIQDIYNQISELGLTSQETLDTPGTPQYNAVQWLANVDGAKLRAGDPFLMQRYILAVLFYSTAGTEEHVSPVGNWNDQTLWMTSSGFCSWFGVKCELDPAGPTFNGNGVVTALNLTQNGLAGSLPSELAGLDGLLRLDLSQNSLTGTLPKSLASLDKLLNLFLRRNELSGILPSEYGVGFGSLRQLSLGENNLRGPIPKEIEHMTNLLALGLESNEFEGHIPDLRDLQKLTRLYLEANKLDGPFPSSVTQLTSLVELNLSENHITGVLPEEMEQLTRLEKMILHDMNMRGTIPEKMFEKVTRLTEIVMYNNEFTGQIPTTIGFLKDVQMFLLGNNKFGGTLPKQIGLMADLHSFHVSGNSIGGTIPELIIALKDLKELGLGRNAVTGNIPPDIGDLRHLQLIHLEDNQLSGPVPTEMGLLKSLTELRLFHNNLTGSMPQEVCSLTTEEELEFLGADCKICDCCTKCF